MRKMVIFIFLLSSLSSLSLFSQDVTDAEELDLDLLLNTTVSTGSEKSRSISESPSLITVITKEDIENSGAQNLYDLLSLVPGVQLMDTYWRGRTLVFRGILMSHYNDKSLLLVNGVPLYEAVNREYYLNQIPISAIKSIEIIRGPGSVMYGTNAFSGVINIQTIKGSDEKYKSYVEGKAGSQSTFESSLMYKSNIDNLNIMAAASFHGDDGYDSPEFADMAGTIGSLNFEDDYKNLFLNVSYNDFQFDLSYYKEDFVKFGMVPHFSFTGDHVHEGFNIALKYKHDFSEKFSFNGWVRYNDHDRVSSSGIWGSYSHDPIYEAPNFWGYKGQVLQSSLKFNYIFSDAAVVSIGFSMEKLSYDDVLTLYDDPDRNLIHPTYISQTEISSDTNKEMFFQVEGDPVNWIGYVVGGRYVKLENGESDFSPRIGFVFRVKDGLSIKSLYQKSFRAPAALEMYTNIPGVLNGDINLKPETNKTIELALDWMATANTSLRINYYNVKIDNLILREVKGDPPTPTYSNIGSAKYNGIEMEIKSIWNEKFNTFFNTSFANGEDGDGNDLLFFADKLANLGFDIKPIKNLTTTLRIQYVGKREGMLTSGEEYSQDSYTLFNVTVNYKITENLSFKLDGVNVSDKEYFYPEHVRKTSKDMPGGMPASVFASLKYKF